MVVTEAVFQLPMFWLNADAEPNACRADPTPSTPQRTEPSAPAVPRHAAAPYIALQHTPLQQVVLHRTSVIATSHHLQILYDRTQGSLTVEPSLAHICAGTRQHLRRDSPTSAPGPLLRQGLRLRAACVRRHKGAYALHGRH
jgi:hypothetical protein